MSARKPDVVATLRKLRAYAVSEGAGFTVSPPLSVPVDRIGITCRGGYELILTAREAEIWLGGYLAGYSAGARLGSIAQ